MFLANASGLAPGIFILPENWCDARGRRGEENIEHVIRLAFDFDQHFLLQFVCSDECHIFYFTEVRPLCITKLVQRIEHHISRRKHRMDPMTANIAEPAAHVPSPTASGARYSRP